jgi:general secretion pathway protein G
MMPQRGFTLLELIVVIVIISILVTAALNRFLPLIDEAERVSVLRLEGQLRSTLMMEAAQRIVRGEAASITDLERSNPVDLLAEPPKNYLGEFAAADYAQLEKRHWYFEEDHRRLVYHVGDALSGKENRSRWQNPAFVVRVAYQDNDGNGEFDVNGDELYGVHLERVAGARWLQAAAN